MQVPGKDDALAAEQFVLLFTVPIFAEVEGKPTGPIATGTLFEILDRSFLITAYHPFETYNIRDILCPKSRGSPNLYDLGQYGVLYPNKSKFDAVAIELIRPVAKEFTDGGWRFLSLQNVKAPRQNGTFMLAGFPQAVTHTSKKMPWYPPILAFAERLLETPPEATDLLGAGLDLFFTYGRVATNLFGGKDFETPKLQGTSGCSIWEYQHSAAEQLWVPPRVVGVQTRFFHSQYFRAIHWQVVATLLEQRDPALREAIESHLRAE
jgi:hypothetical protein